MDPLDEAFETVLASPHFSQYSREELLRCDTFCAAVRAAPHDEVVALQGSLEEIAYETDDHNKASGFLIYFAAAGGGLPGAPEWDVPIGSVAEFMAWAVAQPADHRDEASEAAGHQMLQRLARMTDDDDAGRLLHHQLLIISHYVLEPAKRIAWPYVSQSFDPSYPVREQIPEGLWEAFSSRPEHEVATLVEHWWGPQAAEPHDFHIALEWQRAGHIEIAKTTGYFDAVAKFLLSDCEPDPDHQRPSHGVEALRLDPFLEADLLEALSHQGSFRWLLSFDISARAAYLEELFAAGALQREDILAALDHGISMKWDRESWDHYRKLRERITPD